MESDASAPAAVSALEVLSAYFVESFAAFEEQAQTLRATDPRYTFQNNRWRLSAGSTIYDSYPLAASRVEYAHAAGLTGAGQIVSVVDSGFLTTHEAFAGKDIHLPSDGVGVDSHGTGVASIVAGNSATMIGVAPGADLSLGTYTSQSDLAEATREALRLGAVAQNNSWGYSLAATQNSFDIVFGSGSPYLTALEDYAAQGVVLFAASNDETRTTSTLMEALPALRPELESGWLAVVNAVPQFDEERVLSAELISSACLDAARWCIAADGATHSATSTGIAEYRFATGTSFATPQVSGAMALLAEAFPALDPHDLRVRLLASADNSFFAHDGSVELAQGYFHGYNSDFGHGFLDLRAALLPIGEPVIPTASGKPLNAKGPILVSGSVSGDAAVRSLSPQDVLVMDSLGGDFRMGADALVARVEAEPVIGDRLKNLGEWDAAIAGAADLRRGGDVFSVFAAPRVSFTDPAGSAGFDVMLPGGSDNFGISLSRGVSDSRGSLNFGVSLLRDGSGTLGLSALDGSASAGWAAAVDVAAMARLSGGARLSIFGQFGVASGSSSSDIGLASDARFASVGLDLGRSNVFRAGDTFAMGISLPTALTSGSARMTLPVSRSAGGVTYDTVAVDLAPEHREMRLSLRYHAPMGGGWDFVAEGVHAMNHGHVAGATDTGALFGLQAKF